MDTTTTSPRSKATCKRRRLNLEADSSQEHEALQWHNKDLIGSRKINLRAFKYSPLKDASNQIRLLKFGRRGVCEPITVDMSTWTRSEAPPYYAISYTWGEKRMREMYINGRPVLVRQNCFYALWQAQLRHRNDYIWIDCLCIDQDNDQEKSKQVAIMYTIFEAAAEVLVCIGPCEKNSEYLVTFCDLIKLFRLPDYFFAHLKEEFKALFESVDDVLNEYEDIDSVHRAIDAVSQLRYWNRLWVVQEMIASSLKFDVLYGSSAMPYSVFAYLVIHCYTAKCLSSDDDSFYMLLVHDLRPEWGSRPIRTTIPAFWRLECADPRDHVYCTFSLLNKTHPGWEQLRPDYSKPLWKLVLEVAPHIDFDDFEKMIAAFGTDSDNADVRGVLSKHRFPHKAFEINKTPLASVCPFKLHGEVHRIARDSGDSTRLTVDLLREYSTKEDATEIEEFASLLNTACENIGLDLPQPRLQAIWDRDHLVALTTADAEAGDILARAPGRSISSQYYLILRHVRNDDFAIVGQGIGVNDVFEFRRGVDMTLHLTAEEALVHMAQDFKAEAYRRDQKSEEYLDKTARLLRVVTKPKLSPGVGATFHWKCKKQRADFMGETFEIPCDCEVCRDRRWRLVLRTSAWRSGDWRGMLKEQEAFNRRESSIRSRNRRRARKAHGKTV